MDALRKATIGFTDKLNTGKLSEADQLQIRVLLSMASKTLDYVEKVITRDEWYSGTNVP